MGEIIRHPDGRTTIKGGFSTKNAEDMNLAKECVSGIKSNTEKKAKKSKGKV